ncbi:hypothetical protein BBF96_14890 [Anoxybacter fermentans]|uniref:Large ribosomal subunit protein bL25 n=1 Tax=Anoxybacter fermentans TaxID=1323375 RepID=A0A3Q9HS58_9FIRM|nr:50S ribosomal protein L25/general stress protein Ctc [Anoxybacter fermentans]AZR74560.1 hypothetical protein BBF96_14890 [Anoxybacter fermentans]
MERLTLKADIREGKGKGAARRLRAEGRIPAILYGKDREPVTLAINERDLEQIVGKTALIDLNFGDEKVIAILKEVQRDPIKGFLLHADLQAINLSEKITITVPLHFEGTPVGVKEGGVLQTMVREVELECLPTEMPDYLAVDISDLEIGESLTIGEIDTPENIEILTPAEEVVVTVVAPEGAEEEAEEAAEGEEGEKPAE